MTEPNMIIAIIGGGTAGLTTAISIAKFSGNKILKVNVYEATNSFTEIGAGITLWKRPWNALKALGLEDDLKKICRPSLVPDGPRLSFQYRKSDQREGIHFYDMVPPTGPIAFHRAEFLDCLVHNLDKNGTNVRFGKRLTSFKTSSDNESRITMQFKDGSEDFCDVLIGTDGIHSATRRVMLELAAQNLEINSTNDGNIAAKSIRNAIEPVWSGHTAYRAIADSEKLRNLSPSHGILETPRIYCGKGKPKHITAYPISDGRLISVAAYQSWPEKVGSKYEGKTVSEHSTEELIRDYEGWEEEVTLLLKCIEKPSRWAVTVVNPLPICAYKNVAIMGDAAHAMTPHEGTGAGQAIEDAYILGSLLGHPSVSSDTVPVALSVYQEICLPHAHEAQRRSSESGLRKSFQHPRFLKEGIDGTKECTDEDIGKLWEIGHESADSLKINWTTNIEDDRMRAIKTLEENLRDRSIPM